MIRYPDPPALEPSPLAFATAGCVMRTFRLEFRDPQKGRVASRAAVERRDVALVITEAIRPVDLLLVCERILHWMAMRGCPSEYDGPSLATLGPELQAALEADRPRAHAEPEKEPTA